MARVLAIEDCEAAAMLLHDSFPTHAPPGSELVIAASVQAGVARIRERVPDLVLLDLHLPDGDGWDLIRHELDRLEDSAVVVWTGDDRAETRDRATRDADGYIHKSVAMPTLWPAAFAVLDGLRRRARATDDILIVNDDAAENALLAEVLEPFVGSGSVLVARTVDEAIALVDAAVERRAVPGLALIDVQLPCATGDALLEHLAARPEASAMRAAMLTGCATPSLQARCLALGAREVVIKPYTIDGWTSLFARLVPARRSA